MPTSPRPRFAAVLRPLLLALALAVYAPAAHAEDAEMESLDAEAVRPRASARSAAFEMVAIAYDRGLAIFLDSAAENAPVQGATVQLDVGSTRVPVREEAPGVYTPVGWSPSPGRHDLRVTVTAGSATGELAATLAVPEPAAAPGGTVRTALVSPAVVIMGGLTAVLAAGVAFGRRRAAALRHVPAEG